MEKVYLKRKIDALLENWLNSKRHSPAVIFGIRQCGKSESIRHFANSHFKYVNYIDFWKYPEARNAFDGSLDIDTITRNLSSLFQTFKFEPKQSVLILDEIQDCPRARLSLKSFKEDGRYEVIASGSYIGLNIDTTGVPKPNGSEDFFEMKTMSFEEFLWAKGYKEDNLDIITNCFYKKEKVPDVIHNKFKELFNEYICVGGYPEVVLKYIEDNSFSEVYKKLNSLIFDIKGDPSKRKVSDKVLYTQTEISRIQSSFDLIASFIVNDNKRFILNKISGNGYQKEDAINYLLNSSVAFKVNNVNNLSLPLEINKINSNFKLYYSDIGILVNILGFETIKDILQNNLGMNKGYLYEAVVADSLYKENVPLYYFAKNSGLEIDFVIPYNGKPTLIEVKSNGGNTKSSKTILSHPEHYGKVNLIKIGNYNISENNNVINIPHYMTYLLGKNELK